MKSFFSRTKQICLFVIFGTALLGVSCATTPIPSAGMTTGGVSLARDAKDKSLLWWERTGFDWHHYHKLLLDPVTIRTGSSAPRNPEELAAFVNEITDDFTRILSPEYPVVTLPGEDVLRIRVVITELDTASPALNLLTTLAVFMPLDMGGAAIEADFLDATSGERLAAMADRKTSTPLGLKDGFSRYGYARAAFKTWAEELKIALVNNP